MHTIETTLYQYDELPTDEARERARDWYTSGGLDCDWWDCVYDDAKEIGAALGFTIDDIFFSGFSCQGDGASFRGGYRYSPGWRKKLAEYCPKETDIFAIGEALQGLQRRRFYGLTARIRAGDGRYSHEMTMAADVETIDGREVTNEEDRAVLECARDFARWIYSRLEREHDYLTGEESVADSIRANEYEFLESGRRA